MSVTFAKDTTTVVLQNPDLGDRKTLVKGQAVERMADGRYVRFALSATDGVERELHWSNLRRSEYEALESFFKTTANGVLNDFTFTDERGTAYNAHFLDADFDAETVRDAVASSQKFTSGAVQYPTTTRTGGIYACSVKLKLW